MARREPSAPAPRSAKSPARARTRSKPAPAQDAALERLEALASRLQAVGESLERGLAEAPKPADFEPLADHLYNFAVSAPRLLEALEEVPRAASRIEASLAALREVAETLQFAHDSFAESLLRLPRAEEFEPLAAPLSEFARVAPSLAEALAETLRATRTLGESVRALGELGESLRRGAGAAPREPLPPAGARALREASERMRDGAAAILAALDALPRDASYARVADQLRELASVSPSLLAWLGEVPTLAAPLSESVQALRGVADSLAAGSQAATAALGTSRDRDR